MFTLLMYIYIVENENNSYVLSKQTAEGLGVSLQKQSGICVPVGRG